MGRLMGKGTQRQLFNFCFFTDSYGGFNEEISVDNRFKKYWGITKLRHYLWHTFTCIFMTHHDFDRGFLHFAAADVVYLFAWAAPNWVCMSQDKMLVDNAVFKGEVWAICRFWVFDGNRLLGHRRIDSRWFEKNPPMESGWKQRSKKTPTYRYFARKCSWRNMCFQVRAISSRLWFTYIFAFDSGSLSIGGGWRKCGTLLIFCQIVVLVCPLLLQE